MKVTYSSDVAMTVAETLKAETSLISEVPDDLHIQLPYDVELEPWHSIEVDTNISVSVSSPGKSTLFPYTLAGLQGVNVRVMNLDNLSKGETIKLRIWNSTSSAKTVKRGTLVIILTENFSK